MFDQRGEELQRMLDDIGNEETIERVRGQVLDLCKRHPVYA